MKSIAEIKNEFKNLSFEEIKGHVEEYKDDPRKGVQTFLASQEKRYAKYQEELLRIETIRRYENENADYEFICGIDEVGRGPLAGPVVASAVILPKDCKILYINDSKKLSEKMREELNLEIREKALAVGIGMMSHEVIDEINILQATYAAMRQAIESLDPQPRLLLNDAVTIPGVNIPQIPIIKGDAKSISIGAASIVAKVCRDHMMEEFDKIYPEYHFASNKGYGSKEHMDALRKYGPCPIHRRTFIKSIIGE